MSQIDLEVQLQVWKDLALSKQVLMTAATDALGLDAECSTAELKEALESALKRVKEADANVIETRESAEKQLKEMKQKVETSDRARIEAEEKVAAAETARDNAERQLSIGKAENTELLKKAKADVVDKQNKLKAISKALADTPENVVKKLKTLKKQKMDESKLRTQAEATIKKLRKENSTLESNVEELKALIEKGAELAGQAQSLHELCTQQNKKIESLSDNAEDIVDIPEIDTEAVEALQQAQEKK